MTTVISVSVLAHPNMVEPLIIDTDALDVSSEIMFMHDRRSVAFFSLLSFLIYRHKAIVECNIVDIVLIMTKWGQYLVGWRFVFKWSSKVPKEHGLVGWY